METVLQISKKRCLSALLSAVVVAVCVVIGVTMNLTTLHDENFDHMGLRTFCMFTVNSNILCGLGMMMSLPYMIDGLRKKNFHMPDWTVGLLFAGVTSVSLTFIISLFVLSPVKGFVLIFTGSRFFLHGLCPVLAILAFCFFITNHVISLRDALIATTPVLLYAMVYYFMVEILGPDNGGWDDFYGFLTRIPQWISLLLFMPITFGIAAVLRLLHNGTCRLVRRRAEETLQREFAGKDMREQVALIAEKFALGKNRGNILIPVWLLRAAVRNGSGEMSVPEACRLYLDLVTQQADDP